jgi:hypothetical protein
MTHQSETYALVISLGVEIGLVCALVHTDLGILNHKCVMVLSVSGLHMCS